MEENKQIVKEESVDTGYKIAVTAFMLIGIVATGNVIISGGKKVTSFVKDKIMWHDLKKEISKED